MNNMVSTKNQEVVILVVDEESLVRRLVEKVLLKNGYAVQTASDGHEAVQLFLRQPERVALLLTDLTISRKSGIDLIQQVKKIKPELPVLAMSGDPSQWDKLPYGIFVLPKPFSIDALLGAVAQHLKAA
jgi:DNA-binding NtrC family response regulator